ncbi:DUF6223 family protein [Nonomuraea sp. SBT364]|uniref:DUF6223 family protein n=1 Tax=Nonomuraea sp. SBT364 TaxID=1580530 RepID=UPI00066C1514|nr:DUF6223 family protein [Nonomuraea sp. SBT364]
MPIASVQAVAVLITSVQPDPASVYAMSTGRLGAIVAALAGLAGAVIGARALARRSGGRGPVVAVVTSLIGMAIGVLVVVTSDGGIGTGNGLGGAFMALLVGLAGTVLGGLAMARSRRRAG